MAKGKRPKKYVKHHEYGTVWATGQTVDDLPRKDGTKLRSGHFEDGEQVGEWTTYDKGGQPYKVTKMKRKGA